MASCSLRAEVTPALSALHWDLPVVKESLPSLRRPSKDPCAQGSQNTFVSIQFCTLFLSLVFLSHKPRYHDLPKGHITIRQRSAVASLGMKAPCDLCHVLGAYSAAYAKAKSGTKKCFHDRRGTVWTSFAFGFVSNPVCAAVVLHRFERQGSSGVLPGCSTQQSLSNASASTPEIEDISCVPAK